MDGILRDVENMKISCYLILAGWHHWDCNFGLDIF